MGRFFPSPDVDDVIRNFVTPSDDSYNATFTYPERGAFEYVKALATAWIPTGSERAKPLPRSISKRGRRPPRAAPESHSSG